MQERLDNLQDVTSKENEDLCRQRDQARFETELARAETEKARSETERARSETDSLHDFMRAEGEHLILASSPKEK